MKNKILIIFFSVFLVFVFWGIMGNRGNLGMAIGIVAFFLLMTFLVEIIYKKFLTKKNIPVKKL